MNKFIGFFIVFLFLSQFSFLPFIGIEINFLLIFVIILAQKRFDFSGIIWILICGIIFDIFSSQIFGINTLSFILITLLVNFVNSFFVAFESNKWINSVVYFIGKIFFDLIKYYLAIIFVMIRIADSNVIMISKIFSFSYVFQLIMFTIVSFALLVLYEKLEKISGEKRHDLIINKK